MLQVPEHCSLIKIPKLKFKKIKNKIPSAGAGTVFTHSSSQAKSPGADFSYIFTGEIPRKIFPPKMLGKN
jgi:hypothetical protein